MRKRTSNGKRKGVAGKSQHNVVAFRMPEIFLSSFLLEMQQLNAKEPNKSFVLEVCLDPRGVFAPNVAIVEDTQERPIQNFELAKVVDEILA